MLLKTFINININPLYVHILTLLFTEMHDLPCALAFVTLRFPNRLSCRTWARRVLDDSSLLLSPARKIQNIAFFMYMYTSILDLCFFVELWKTFKPLIINLPDETINTRDVSSCKLNWTTLKFPLSFVELRE
jgi:hypothetical protein